MVDKIFSSGSQVLLTKAMHIEDLYSLDTASLAIQVKDNKSNYQTLQTLLLFIWGKGGVLILSD